ncbi:MAG: hypothetical protein HOO19_21005 [Rhodospirillaceae bacterium]|jgi:hypothetical protein|nr:hypothetical protein [Rhodospirillaceae bacterium]MBT4119262.1 hypothetical protein [Rhodospirillaceae bacterium]MBT4670762.1 hypothetical protein [Rhodospirillaceae bacterium]MBT4721899.1 hypothetical protein [Rhodospirillaceae bacterium]MBT4751819.1 hypothetical protein [Rhodospirillaceae bacterium]
MIKSDAKNLDNDPELAVIRARLPGTNINQQTLLATDYLNHFNEIVMTLGMVPDFRDLMDDAKDWQPISYTEHFQNSAFSDKDLAIEAYEHVPERFLTPFEQTIGQVSQLIETVIQRMDGLIANGSDEELRHVATSSSQNIQRLLEIASAIINGAETTMDQTEIDTLLGD